MKEKKSAVSKVPKWLRIVLPTAIIAVWLILAGIGGPYFGKIDEVADSDLSAFLPSESDAAKVAEEAAKFRTDETVPAIMLFKADKGELSEGQKTQIDVALTAAEQVEAATDASEVQISEDGKAAFSILPLESNGEVDATVKEVREVMSEQRLDGMSSWVTGPAGFVADLSAAFGGIDGILLVVALGVVFVILLLVYRSPLLPVLVLLSALAALSVAVLIVWWMAKNGVVQLNGQVQGILFILVIGAATDYSLLFVSRLREELYAEKDKARAIVKAWKGVFEPIVASGGTVIAGLMCLLLSELGANIALGPVGSVGIVMAMLVALTFLPAMLFVVGRAGFWPRIPRTDKASVAEHTRRQQKGIWHRVGDLVSKHPRVIWMITTLVLGVCALGATQLKADGVPQDEYIIGYSEAHEGQDVLSKHFPDGSGSPVLLLVPTEAQDAVVVVLDADKNVEAVGVTATGVSAGFKPLGDSADEIRDEIRATIQVEVDAKKADLEKQADAIAEQAGPFGAAARQQFLDAVLPNIPSVDQLVTEADPFKDAEVTVVDDTVLMTATLTQDPYSAEAEATVKRIRSEVGQVDGRILVGGTTATSLDTNAASLRDRTVIIPVVLGVITIILMILLRAIIAPILLLATTVLSFAASLGVAAFLFNNVWHFPGADSSVLLYSFIFLVALGIDYNIFLMTRVREESLKLGTKAGVIKGLVVTGGVITSAGIVLAATFASLVVIPILFLVEIAFVVAFGVLLDTIIVRSLLVPALIRDIGGFVWWPSKLRKK